MFDIARGGELDVCTFTRCCCCCCWCELMWNEHFFFSKGNAETERRTELSVELSRKLSALMNQKERSPPTKKFWGTQGKNNENLNRSPHSLWNVKRALCNAREPTTSRFKSESQNWDFFGSVQEEDIRIHAHTQRERESSRKLFILWRTRKRREWVIFKRLGVQKISLARA